MKKVSEADQELILSLISPTEKITLRELSSITGYSYRRIKEIITELRKLYPIVSSETNGGGYWIATTDQELFDFINLIKKRMHGYQRTIRRMQALYNADTVSFMYHARQQEEQQDNLARDGR